MKVDQPFFHDHDSSSINLSSGSSLEDSDRYSVTTSESDSNKERIQKSRCRSEKKRRDKLNLFIKDLQLMLPPSSSKRLDKSTVLKMTVDYLKLHNDLSVNMNGEGKINKSFFLPCEELGELMLEILNGFIMVINEDAKIVYVADVIEKLLGVKTSFYTSKTIHAVIHKDDQAKLSEELMSGVLKDDLNMFHTGSIEMDMLSDSQFLSSNTNLDIRLLVEKEDGSCDYRLLHCTGKWYSFKDQEYPFGDKLLVLLACLQKSGVREILNENVSSFSSKHSLDGKFLFADTDCLNVTGHLPYELLGKSIYIFVHDDDLMDLCKVHEKLTKMSPTSAGATTVYIRFRSKAEEWLLCKADFQLIRKVASHLPDHIAVKFTLANAKEVHEFRRFVKKKEFRIEDYLPNVFDGCTEAAKQGPALSLEDTVSDGVGHENTENTANDAPSSADENLNDEDKDDEERTSSSNTTSPSNVSPSGIASTVVNADNLVDDVLADVESQEAELNTERFFEAQHYLHEQLRLKHETLAQSYKKQKVQLERIGSLMQEYKIMMQAPSFKSHYEQQQEMFDYFKYMTKKQHRKQEYLYKQLKGRVKELAIKQRAMKLRDLASRQQKTFLSKLNQNEENKQEYSEPESPSDNISTTLHNNKPWQPNKANILKFTQARGDANVVYSSKHNVSIQSPKPLLHSSISTATSNQSPTPNPTSSVQVSFTHLQDKLKWLQQIQQEATEIQHSGNSRSENMTMSSPNYMLAGSSNAGSENSRDLLHLNLLSEQLRRQSTRSFSPDLTLMHPNDHSDKNDDEESNQASREQSRDETDILSNNALSQRRNSDHSNEFELQSKISKQILIHLQALQKNILQQLQSVLHDKKESQSDFSQILPVLQQLQQLQQSIIEQQQNQHKQTVVSPSQSSPRPRSNDAHNHFVFPNDFVTNNMELQMLQAQQDHQSAGIAEIPTTLSELTVDTENSHERAREKLDKIKTAFNYQEDETNKIVDCFEKLDSPDLSSLMCSKESFEGPNSNSCQGDNNNSPDDDLKQGKNVEEEQLPNFQPLMENQQHLEELQQYQRMQIFVQQQQLHSIHAMQSINGQPGGDEDNTLNEDETSADPSNSSLFNNSPGDFPLTGEIPDISTFIPPENEEVINMLMNDSEFYW